MKQIFFGIFEYDGKIYTKNSTPGSRVYGEKLIEENNVEFREWNPYRSKLAAAIMNGLKEVPLRKGSNVLYLGAAEGTTASHISDIIGESGAIFAVDVSARVMRKLIEVAEQRKNIIPLLADAGKPESYEEHLQGMRINLLYQDVSQKNQAEIFIANAEKFLRKGSAGLIAIKARSISQQLSAKKIFDLEINKLENEFKIKQRVALAPFDRGHLMVLCEKR